MIEYRRAEAADAEGIARLHTRSWRESYRGSFTDEFLDGDLLEERLAVWHERLHDPPEAQLVQLAVEGPDLHGFACVYAAQDPDWGSLIDNLHVAADAKRKGVGTSLMRQAGVWLEQRNPDLGVYLWVLEANASGRRFYESIGAENSGVSTMETHGSAIVRSCRYTWPTSARLASA